MRDLLKLPVGREREHSLAEIKSALELALEKAEQYGKASPEEMAAEQYKEQGQQLAVEYLKGGGDLPADLKKLPPQARPGAKLAIREVFLRNIGLPRESSLESRQDQALEGLIQVADNPQNMARLQTDLEQLLQQYLQIRNNAMQQLKGRFAGGVEQMQRAMEAQYRQKVNLDAEHLPQFQEEWRRFMGQLNDQFEPMLEGLKDRMRLA
jgi:hypothetical protein